ncbi:MAG TPA: FimV/HubP family polar landmark protein, partial [Mariprofundaceae bacterium]|nr:FimV/HubP family polar landmark protein [Mariprofundaceae bacterium]
KVALGFLAVAAWLISAASAWAVSLGKIDIASHLGEPFYAEVPLQLDNGESISNVYVELASPADYRILEVYRDPALNAITVDVKTDKRGARVVLSSDSGVESPFFNLVLKVRYERATHFKKYPVFLDIPQMARPSVMKPVPAVKEGQPRPAPSQAAPVVQAKPAAPAPGSGFAPFDGWARIARYGPMVFGDTITTVAQRLQVDDRYTRQQVMVALFEKNRAKFDHDNINLIKAGTYLDVPTAAEVERISPDQARGIIAKQEKEWKELVKQPKYAAVAEAQKNRYSKRVRVGENASGVASAPMPSQSQQGGTVQAVQKGAPAANAEAEQKQTQMQQQIQQLQQQNSELQGKLTDTQKQLADASAKSDEAAAAAADAKVKKLQIQLARLQAERDEALQKAQAQPSPLGWLTYALLGVIVLLLGVVGYLMRREPAHPAESYAMPEPQAEPHGFARPSPDSSDMFEEAPEIDVEEVPHKGFDAMATMQMNAAEVTKEFTDSIPDLTDEDTGKMEAFQEEIEEEPDPNVDYLAEADVYLRYGMEDEAIQQVKMAFKLDPHNADAHIKMVQVLKAKNDQPALDEAITEARQALGGSALQRFEEAVSNLDEAVADAFADTMPPTMAEELAEFEGGESLAEEAVEAAEPELTAGGEPEAEQPKAGAEDVSGGLDDLDLEWPEFEDAETPMHEAQAEVAAQEEQEEGEQEERETPPAAAPARPSEGASSGDMEFDLSDLEIPEADIAAAAEGAESRAASFVDTSDLEKTVAIDWSQETSVESDEEEDMIGESGAEGVAEVPVESAEPEPAAEEKPKPEASSAIDDGGIDLGDFDFDQAEAERDATVGTVGTGDDEFSSTIRTTLVNVEAHTDEEAEPLFDLSSEDEAGETVKISAGQDKASAPVAEPEDQDDEASASGKVENESSLLLDLGDDLDETQKLDDLLSEFADESEKDGGKKGD